ncbi:MAG: peptide/nickel transport system permease protein [Candidatus Binatia bacterium]|jgi:peptide/nickel transport system permease protein
MSRQRSQRGLIASTAAFIVLLACALGAPVLSPAPPTTQDLTSSLAAPSLKHPLGCDKLGRDVAARLLHGARVSLTIGAVTVLISLMIGATLGAIAGYVGGAVDFWAMRVVDVFLAFPGLLLAIALAAVLGPGVGNVIIALAATGWTGYARLVRGEVMRLRSREHVEAARALGMGETRILLRHIAPLLVAPLSVQASFGIAGAIVAEAGLGFLGLGVAPPTPSWGSMLAEGRGFMLIAPRLVILPGLAISVTVLVLNLLGESLRDALDVRAQ